ncbi:ubiquitin carboxyl-terminal hydrolase family protein, putative (macronuclear) [Tetrahymena thermophila SB210]|uniref:Ubiquitin carboxyl-terminal hydrolase family protein, putative n=1 Tax=Tetrahymena thermophila (strain SB210) TaxID=312017 RepID=Q22WI2_TETTS|nr:ubiquitin carboxyl-terminal hydrolase family protein, putative [Tetrahymena thermophila SB210]EAR89435.1 ubiquitin carboxyl-terminal hydrolase family protein, putative [Tetrahymena thermophila SB210]|eukprot:XP_001009680.1 ubiquitin carboxyl-terminal hydrolase family protein, putative [Tetrahymena thermophila SB210]
MRQVTYFTIYSIKQKEQAKNKNEEKLIQIIDNKKLTGLKVSYFSQETPQFLCEPLEHNSKIQTKILKFENLLDEFFGLKVLNKINNCYNQKAMKKFYLYKTPYILTLVLKKLAQDENNGLEKVKFYVDIPARNYKC